MKPSLELLALADALEKQAGWWDSVKETTGDFFNGMIGNKTKGTAGTIGNIVGWTTPILTPFRALRSVGEFGIDATKNAIQKGESLGNGANNSPIGANNQPIVVMNSTQQQAPQVQQPAPTGHIAAGVQRGLASTQQPQPQQPQPSPYPGQPTGMAAIPRIPPMQQGGAMR